MTKRLSDTLTAAAFTGLFALCLALVALRLLGLGTYIVTGSSMEPNIHKGSLVLVQPTDAARVAVGDVITFQQYGQTTTHRVITVGQSPAGLTFKTKGDANTVADPEDKTLATANVVRVAIPLVGYAASSLQAYWRLVLTLLAAIVFFSCASAFVLQKKTAVAAHAPRLVRRTAPVSVNADEAWDVHLAWIAAQRRARAA